MPSKDELDFEKLLDDAETETIGQFADKISKLTRLSADDIKTICPAKEDRAAFEELLSIVNSKAKSNQQKAQLVENVGKLGNVLLAIVKKTVLPL